MNDKKLRQRFVKDYNLPINVFSDEMFEYYAGLYDFFPKQTWEKINDSIENNYNGNVELWLDYCAEVRDKAINYVMGTQKYFDFNVSDMSIYKLTKNIGEHSYYTEATDGCRFVSIDLKKANFQALKYVGVVEESTYDELIEKMGGDEYIKNSKYLRQVIFGKMNPGRTITVEKYIMSKIMDIVESLIVNGIELYSQNSDEIVYKVIDDISIVGMFVFCNTVENVVKQKMNIDVRAEYVEIKKLPIVNCNCNNVDAFVRKNLLTGEEVLKKASTTFYPQIYKLWKGMEIENRDLVFYFEDQLATFNKPLKLIEK